MADTRPRPPTAIQQLQELDREEKIGGLTPAPPEVPVLSGPPRMDAAVDEQGRVKTAPFIEQAARDQTSGGWGRGGTLGLGLGVDPWETVMQRNVNPFIEKQALPDVAKWALEHGLPQNSPQLATGLALGAVGGPLAAGARGLTPVITRALGSALLGGGVGGVTGYLTGHDPLAETLWGGVGGTAASLGSDLVRTVAQGVRSRQLMATAREGLTNFMDQTLGHLLPAQRRSAHEIWGELINGNLVTKAEDAIGNIAATAVRTPRFLLDEGVTKMATTARKMGKDVYETVAAARGGTTDLPSIEKLWRMLPSKRDYLSNFLPGPEKAAYDAAKATRELAGAFTQWVTSSDKKLSGEAAEKLTETLLDRGRLSNQGLAKLYNQLPSAKTALENIIGAPRLQQLEAAMLRNRALLTTDVVDPGRLGLSRIPQTLHGAAADLSRIRTPLMPGWQGSITPSMNTYATKALSGAIAGQPMQLAAEPEGPTLPTSP